MKRVLNLLPTVSGHYGFASFNEGFKRLGYEPTTKLANPVSKDLVVVWNRQGNNASTAAYFEKFGARVVVVENSYFGKQFRGAQYFAVALGHHNGAGRWPGLGGARWASWGVPLAPWRPVGGETLVLGQRGIGERGLASPPHWAQAALRQFKGARVRPHPGPAVQAAKAVPLEQDLARVGAVVTWASSAAVQALRLGVPVYYDCHSWIGKIAARHMNEQNKGPVRDDALRLAMFERLSWAMWSREEVAHGDALATLLSV